MSKFLDKLKKIEPPKEKRFLHTLFDGFFTFAYAPNHVTRASGGVHIRDGMDLKRTMFLVVQAMALCYVFGTYNIGHQHYAALGMHEGFLGGFLPKLLYGLLQILPIFIVSNLVGLGIEFFYAAKKGHAIEEGYLVSGALIPLIMPPDIPLWMLAIAIAFAVIIGKEAFGGTGMNVLNIALLARVFVFFAYPGEISGDFCWVAYDYNFLHSLFGLKAATMASLGIEAIPEGMTFSKYVLANTPDTWTGATPLALAAKEGWASVQSHYTNAQMFWGAIPGSIGETCKPVILIGAALLIFLRIASWRIMLSMVVGAALTAILMNLVGDFHVFMAVPWQYHFWMGSFFFAMAFMATDPVTAASTPTGKLIYGFMIGVVGMIVRVLNPAYPEGWMLAILFMNVFAPLIDYYVLEANISKRLKRVNS